jgi:hypothetical protein
MAPQSSDNPLDYLEAMAVSADQRAAVAPTRMLAEHWRQIAKAYRWIAYYRRVRGRWRPHPENSGWDPV